MSLQLGRIVIARQIEIVKPRHDAVIDDSNNVRLFLIFRHAAYYRAIFRQRRRAEAFAIAFNHFRQIKVDLVARAVLYEGHAVAVFDLAAHRGNTHRGLRTAAKLSSPLRAMCHLYPPQLQAERTDAQKHEEPENLNPHTRRHAASIHSNCLLSGPYV